jgi:hypothetical protein
MRGSKSRRLSKQLFDISKEHYDADLVIYDRFQSYSAELLKLSLAGLGGIGFFLSFISQDKSGQFGKVLASCWFVFFCCMATGSFTLAVALSLCHRFFATDGLFYHIRAIKLMMQIGITPQGDSKAVVQQENVTTSEPEREKQLTKVEKDEEARNDKFWWSAWCLWLSACGLFLGAASLGGAFLMLLRPIG